MKINARKLFGTAIIATLVVLAALATAPAGLPVVAAAVLGHELDLAPALSILLSDDPVGRWASLMAAAAQTRAFAICMPIWLVAVGALIAFACWLNSLKRPGRSVDQGVLGKQKSVKRKSEILRATEPWDGKADPADGVVVGNVRGRAIVMPCHHAAICAPSGSGKTRKSVYPLIDALTYAGVNNVIVNDPSLEIYISASPCLAERGYEVFLLNLESPRQGNARWNPLSLVTALYRSGDDAEAEARAREIGATLFPATGGENDIFVNAAGGAFSAVAYLVSTLPDVPDERRHLWSVVSAILEGSLAGSGALKDWLRSFGSGSPAVNMASVFLASEGKLESSILSSLHDGLQPFTSRNMRWLTSASDFEVGSLVEGKCALFIHTLGPGSPTNRIASLLLSQHWAEVQRLGKRRRNRACWAVLDEAHSIPKFDLVHAIENARKYSLHYVLYLQSFSGLDQYKTSKEDGKDAILANCDLKVLYKAGSDQDARYFETLSGFRTVRAEATGSSRNAQGGSSSSNYSEQKVPVWPMGDILERDPAIDGALVIKGASDGRPAGKYEIPVVDAASTFTADHFGTLGSREFEKRVISEAIDGFEQRAASVSLDVEAWIPDFESCKSAATVVAGIAADEFGAWD